SACNTAAGEVPGAETLSGLASALLYAGAHAVLVSHWPVDDRAAALLTTRTFSRMRENPALHRAEALRLAMLELLARAHELRQPLAWARFSLIGEGAPSSEMPPANIAQAEPTLRGQAEDAAPLAGAAYERRDYVAALQLARWPGDQGVGTAQNILGL